MVKSAQLSSVVIDAPDSGAEPAPPAPAQAGGELERSPAPSLGIGQRIVVQGRRDHRRHPHQPPMDPYARKAVVLGPKNFCIFFDADGNPRIVKGPAPRPALCGQRSGRRARRGLRPGPKGRRRGRRERLAVEARLELAKVETEARAARKLRDAEIEAEARKLVDATLLESKRAEAEVDRATAAALAEADSRRLAAVQPELVGACTRPPTPRS